MNHIFQIDWSKPIIIKINDGLPDLTVNVVPTKSLLMNLMGVRDSTVVTITVQNRLTLIPPRIRPVPELAEAYGSDAKDVLVSIQLSSWLQQVGNIGVPEGFVASVTPNVQTIYCSGGTIPAGESVDFEIEVIYAKPKAVCADAGTISAEVDPYSWIAEISKSNNKASAKIHYFDGVC